MDPRPTVRSIGRKLGDAKKRLNEDFYAVAKPKTVRLSLRNIIMVLIVL
jgi:hypothetical protein